MSSELSTIVQQLFQQPSLEQVTVETLREFTAKYPYAGIGHVLLAKKDREAGKKAVFYVEDPVWLDYVLEGRSEKEEVRRDEREARSEMREEEEKENGVSVSLSGSVKEEEEEKEKSVSVSLRESVKGVEDAGKGEALVFEPYHTIDYFASMGIKLTREDLDKDRFGRQLKSFTEWLKSMKKIAPEAGKPEQDGQIEQKAAASVQPSEVDTEAMAEVWLKQGNKEKALAIYRKLSLQNPSKSHYFASLIEQINA